MTTRRPRNASQTRADILSAVRRRFATEGYERTTLRAVAADVGVDPALPTHVAPILATATPGHPQERIELTDAFIIGLATTRSVLANPPVAKLSRDELSRWAGPVIRQLLVGPAPS